MINKVCFFNQRGRYEIDFLLAYYESLQDKLSQLKDAREALNALRDDHLENKRREVLESERQRQLQLAVKLGDMREKKQVRRDFSSE